MASIDEFKHKDRFTLDEISDYFGVPKQNLRYYIDDLREKGKLESYAGDTTFLKKDDLPTLFERVSDNTRESLKKTSPKVYKKMEEGCTDNDSETRIEELEERLSELENEVERYKSLFKALKKDKQSTNDLLFKEIQNLKVENSNTGFFSKLFGKK